MKDNRRVIKCLNCGDAPEEIKILRKAYELMAIEMSRTSRNSAESLQWHYLDKAKGVIEYVSGEKV